MTFAARLTLQSLIAAVFGGLAAYCLSGFVPSDSVGELLKLLGGITAISGSLLGWTAGWLDQSRSHIKQVHYTPAAVSLFQEIGRSQKKLIWRWGVALATSLVVVVASVVVKNKVLDVRIVQSVFIIATALLSVSLFSIVSLFQSMLASAALKAQLEEYELEEVRKSKNTPKLRKKKRTNDAAAAEPLAPQFEKGRDRNEG
jgi:hypothetical protein